MTAEQLIATVDLQLSIFNLQPSNHSFLEKNEFENESFPRSPASLRSSKKMNSKTNPSPAPQLPRSLAPMLPSPHPLFSAVKTLPISFFLIIRFSGDQV